ncbi:DUF1244 domain-containing protein [Thiolinea disciformis]|uniref:DUF1244 domain-containing protein n=1 Tax=Thiolinea disciformis TaxID=125614 RepID=UPI00037533FD|nr:DUF1244 domain-containing protein [Thiolinea disciformis]
MDEQTQLAIEAAAWRKLVEHFQKRTDVQNIDLMNMAGFCRNCMSKWYHGAAQAQGLTMDYEQAREVIYGMPYNAFKDKFQKPATPEQLATYDAIRPDQKTE